MRFRTKLFFGWVGLTLGLWAATFLAMRRSVEQSFNQMADDTFVGINRGLRQSYVERVSSMRQVGDLMVSIPELRALIAEQNYELNQPSRENLNSLRERLDYVSGLVGATFVYALDKSAVPVAQNEHSPWSSPAELSEFLKHSAAARSLVQRTFQPAGKGWYGLWVYRGRLYEVAAVPLVFQADAHAKDSRPEGALVIGKQLTDAFATELGKSYGCEISFLAEGMLAASSLPPPLGKELIARYDDGDISATTEMRLGDNAYRAAFEPLLDPCSGLKVGTVAIHQNQANAHNFLWAIWSNLALTTVGGIVAAGFASFVLSLMVTRPVSALVSGVRDVAQGNLSVKFNAAGRDELAELGGAFNDMVSRLCRSRNELQRLLDEARKGAQREHLLHEVAQQINQRLDVQSSLAMFCNSVRSLFPDVQLAVFGYDAEGKKFDPLRPDDCEEMVDSESSPRSPTATQLRGDSLSPSPSTGEGRGEGDGRRQDAASLTPGPAPAEGRGENSSPSSGPPALHLQETHDRLARHELVYIPDLQPQPAQADPSPLLLYYHSTCLVPMRAEQRLLGAIVATRRRPDAFTADERDFLQALADHFAIALANSQLYEELRQAYRDLRTNQQQIIQTERLRAVGQMASGIAHDFNNHLTGALAFLEMSLDRDDLHEELRGWLELSRESCLSAASVVTLLRNFYRRDTDDSLGAVDINKLAASTISLTRPRWRDMPLQHGLVVRVNEDFAEVGSVVGSASELRDALTNLLFNAVDAMPQGGDITVRTRRSGNEIVLEVQDSGTGMSEEVRDKCLEPYFTTKGLQGTGLGLSMVHGIVDRHRGRLTIDSAPGRGTTIRLALRRAELKPGAQAGPEQLDPNQPRRILCVDDDLRILRALEGMLRQLGHDVTTTNSGAEVIERIGVEQFDVLITDLGMPGVDGREVARNAKRLSPSTRVLLLTGWADRLEVEGDMPQGVDKLLGKPITKAQLQQALA